MLLVTRLDRLARSTRDLLNVLDRVSKAGAGFRSLADAWADTTTAHGRLMLTILGGLAEFERELIKIRTSEGRVRAKARGVHMGRHSALNQNQQREALARIEAGDALTDIARAPSGVSHTTIARLKAKASLLYRLPLQTASAFAPLHHRTMTGSRSRRLQPRHGLMALWHFAISIPQSIVSSLPPHRSSTIRWLYGPMVEGLWSPP